MDADDFEGTLVLEQLAAIGKVEDFFDAIDSDDIGRATRLMKRECGHVFAALLSKRRVTSFASPRA